MSINRTIAAVVVANSLVAAHSTAQIKGEQPVAELVPRLRHAGPLPPIKCSDASFKCESLLRVEPGSVPRGGVFRIECGVRCTGGFSDVYNGCLSERLRLPAQIVISSADGSFRENILTSSRLDESDEVG